MATGSWKIVSFSVCFCQEIPVIIILTSIYNHNYKYITLLEIIIKDWGNWIKFKMFFISQRENTLIQIMSNKYFIVNTKKLTQ